MRSNILNIKKLKREVMTLKKIHKKFRSIVPRDITSLFFSPTPDEYNG